MNLYVYVLINYQTDIHSFIQHIIDSENLNIDINTIEMIQKMYHSDIRSMINFIQLHQNYDGIKTNIITNKIWEDMKKILKEETIQNFHIFVQEICIQYNIDKKTVIKQYYNYIIRNYPSIITIEYLNNIEVILHNDGSNIDNMINYMKEVENK